jgi:hypothetical protein
MISRGLTFRNLRLREAMVLHGMHEDRHRFIGNVESSPRFAPLMLDATRRAEEAVRSLISKTGDETMLALRPWIARAVAYASLWRHPDYAEKVAEQAGRVPAPMAWRMIGAEWRLGWKRIPHQEAPSGRLPQGGDTAILLRYMSKGGVRTSTRLTEDFADALARRFRDVAVVEYRGQPGIRRRGNITYLGVPMGTTPPRAEVLRRVAEHLVTHPSLCDVAGTVARRLPRWLARIEFAKLAVHRMCGELQPRLFVAFGANDPLGTLLALRFRSAPQATVTSLVEPVHSSNFVYPTRTVMVTGGLEAMCLREASPETDVRVVGSYEAYDLVHQIGRASTPQSGDILVLGKDPEASWRNREVLRIVLSVTTDPVRYRAKQRSVHLPEVEGDPLIAAAAASGRLRWAHDGELARHLPGARLIVSAGGNALYLALLAGVPTIGYCFNPLVDLGEEAVSRHAGIEFPAPICRTMEQLAARLAMKTARRTLARDIRTALFGDLERPVTEQILEVVSELMAERPLQRVAS